MMCVIELLDTADEIVGRSIDCKNLDKCLAGKKKKDRMVNTYETGTIRLL